LTEVGKLNEPERNDEISIMAVGDIMLGMAYPGSIASDTNLPSIIKSNPSSIIDKKITKLFNKSDIVFGNLECVISDSYNGNDGFFSTPSLVMAPPEAIELLNRNFTHLNITNNHIMDHGVEKVKETVKHLKQSEIVYLGDPISNKSKLKTTTVKEKKIGFLAYNLCVKDKEKEVNTILKQIADKRSEVDLLIVSLHWGWGFEQIPYPSPKQIEWGRKIVDAGGDILLGHHSHVFQPVEIYKNKVIAYSLGNFIFDMWALKNRKSGILNIKINSENRYDVKFIPVVQNNYNVTFDTKKSELNNMIITNSLDIMGEKKYMDWKKKVKKKHKREFLWQYISRVHKLPLDYHKFIVSKRISKMTKKLCNII